MTRAIIILFSVSILFLTSCYPDDFLKDELLSDTSVEFLYNSEEGISNAVVGLYSINREPYERDWFNGAIPLILTAKSDIAAGIDGEISLFSNCFWGCSAGDYGSEAAFGYLWAHHYRIIDISNSIIQGVKNLIDQGKSSSALNRDLAEAYVFRAHSYFTLFRLFRNIYLKTEPTTPDTAFDRPDSPSSQEQIFELIRSDLKFASENFEYSAQANGRWSKGAVDHIRAKVEMWEGNYASAASIIDELIENGPHQLVSIDQVFSDELNHQESLFSIQFERQTIGGGSWQQMNWQTVSHYSAVPGLKQSIENGGDGFGFLSLNPYVIDLLNEFSTDKRKDHYYIFNYKYNDEKTLPAGRSLGDPLALYKRVAANDEFFLYYKRQNPGVIKFMDTNVEPTDRMHSKNIMVYRLAETLLLGAEAHFELGNSIKSFQYINSVRTRAGIPPLTEINVELIFEERARELAFEGQRWYSLKRRGLLYQYLMDHMNDDLLNSYYERNHVNPKNVLTPGMIHLPIPQSQLDLLGTNYPQNEAYN